MKNVCLILLALFAFQNFVLSAELENAYVIKAPSNRLGVGDTPEKSYETVKELKKKEVTVTKSHKIDIKNSYADMSLKKIAIDVSDELEEDEATIYADLMTLWLAAAQNSETIQYAIYKLSNPEENKPDENTLKKIVKPIANLSAIAGTAFAANPFVASSAMIGGGLLSAISSDDKEANYRFTKVNDANMVLLVQKIEELQKQLLNLYMDYKTKKKIYEMALENVQKREKIFAQMQGKTREEVILADVYLRNAQNFLEKAKNDYVVAKKVLEQQTGAKAVEELEG